MFKKEKSPVLVLLLIMQLLFCASIFSQTFFENPEKLANLSTDERIIATLPLYDEAFYRLDSTEIFATIEKIALIAKKFNDEDLVYETEFLKLNFYTRNLHYPKAFVLSEFNKLKRKAQKNNLELLEIRIQNLLGNFLYLKKEYGLGFEHLQRSARLLELYFPEKHPLKQEYFIRIALVYANFDEYQKAKPYLDKALAASTKDDIYHHKMHVINTLGLYHRKFNDFDSSNYYFEWSNKKALKAKDTIWDRISSINLSRNNYQKGRYQVAYKQISHSISQSEKLKIGIALEEIILRGNISLKLNNIDSAHKDGLNAHSLLKKSIDLNSKDSIDFYTFHSKLAAYDQDWKLSMLYMDSTFKIKDRWYVNYSTPDLIQATHRIDIERRENLLTAENLKNIQAKEIKIKDQQTLLLLAIAVLIIALISIYFFFKLSKNRKNTSELIRQEKDFQDDMIQNIVHEFRTPLTLIQGPINELKKTQDSETHERLNRIVERNSEKMISLVNQLLDLSKLKAGKLQVIAEPVSLELFLQPTIESFKEQMASKGIDFVHQIAPIIIDTDADKLHKIISNLLSNAVKFTPNQGRVQFEITGTHENIEICVLDNGPGIPEKDQSRIFDRYFQSDASLNRNSEGTGIGLALVKELIDLLEGEIHLQSNTQGTRFTISLPSSDYFPQKTEATFIPSESKNTTNETSEDKTITTEKTKVLIVEDNPDMREYLVKILEDQNYFVLESTNGLEGMQTALEEIPDLIISDVMMPQVDGLEFLEQVKNNELTDHIPVLLLTAKTTFEDKIDALKLGANDYIFKPFNASELIAKIGALISLRNNIHKQSKNNNSKTGEIEEEVIIHPFIIKVETRIDNNLSNLQFGVEELAKLSVLSRSQLYRKIHAHTGLTTTQFINRHKLTLAKKWLESAEMNVTEISDALGYGSTSYFSTAFKKYFGFTPSSIQ